MAAQYRSRYAVTAAIPADAAMKRAVLDVFLTTRPLPGEPSAAVVHILLRQKERMAFCAVALGDPSQHTPSPLRRHRRHTCHSDRGLPLPWHSQRPEHRMDRPARCRPAIFTRTL